MRWSQSVSLIDAHDAHAKAARRLPAIEVAASAYKREPSVNPDAGPQANHQRSSGFQPSRSQFDAIGSGWATLVETPSM